MRTSRPVEYATYHGVVQAETPKAWLFCANNWPEDKAQWVPKSQCKIERDEISHEVVMKIPEWLVEKNGFDDLDFDNQSGPDMVDDDDAY